jgi:hypothetical protein
MFLVLSDRWLGGGCHDVETPEKFFAWSWFRTAKVVIKMRDVRGWV